MEIRNEVEIDGRTDGRTDGQTDKRELGMQKSVLEHELAKRNRYKKGR